MTKFVIDQNAFSGLADALSGRAKQQGQIDGLKIQAAQEQLMAQRDKALEPIRQQEAQRNYGVNQLASVFQDPAKAALVYDYANGQRTNMGFKMNADGSYVNDEYGAPIVDDTPIDLGSKGITPEQYAAAQSILGPMMAVKSFGGDAVDYSKAQGQLNKNGYEAGLRQGVMATTDPSQRNALVEALKGNSYTPYKIDGYGQRVDTGTGQVTQTPASQVKLGNINSSTQLNQANTGYTNARTGLTNQQTVTEQLVQLGKQQDMQIKAAEAEKKLKGIESMKADEVKTFFSKQIKDDMGKTYFVADTDAYAKFSAWAEQNGYRNEREAYSAYTGRPLLNADTAANTLRSAGSVLGPSVLQSGTARADATGSALQSFGAAIGPNIAQGAAPAISEYDRVNQNQWSATIMPDTVQSFDRMAAQKFGKGFSQMSAQELAGSLNQLYHAGLINRDDVGNLHRIYVTKEPVQMSTP